MSKITVKLAPRTSERLRKHLSEAVDGALSALGCLDVIQDPKYTTVSEYIEVIRIELTTWIPYDQIWVIMVMSNSGKKMEQSQSFTFNPSNTEIKTSVEKGVLGLLYDYLAKLKTDTEAEARAIQIKTDGLRQLIDQRAKTAPQT